MARSTPKPLVAPGGLVTVAFLKAQIDEGSDHLGIFVPLILDSVADFDTRSFTTRDIQETLAQKHKLVIPEQPLATLLGRAAKLKYITRDSGRYSRGPGFPVQSNVAAEKIRIEEGQDRLAQALRQHAARRKLTIDTDDEALGSLFRFLEDEQVSLLLGAPLPVKRTDTPDAHGHERRVIAEFVQDVVRDDPAFRTVLNDILAGLVLYRAAFLPDLAVKHRRFKDLTVVFDSVLVRQALGYEGVAMKTLMRETINVLRASGIDCVVLDKSVHEITRLLGMYEERLATAEGRRSLRSVPMARHFLTQRYSPGDVRQMIGLLETDIKALGLRIEPMPHRVAAFTATEKTLAARLADRRTGDETEPRVVHDVDCVAAILLMRGKHRPTSIEDARAVFATSAHMVIRNTRAWWYEDERETGIEPIVHIRALANLAWLKKPQLSESLNERELVALCTAALRPNPATWHRFLKHLDGLKESNRITSDEVTAVLVSSMSDRLLREVEEDDPDDLDAATLDDVVERVKQSYTAKAEADLHGVVKEYEERLARIEDAAQTAGERAATAEQALETLTRRRAEALDGRAHRIAHRAVAIVSWIVSGLVVAGAVTLIFSHPFHAGWVNITLGIGLVVFVLLELAGILSHVASFRAQMEIKLARRVRAWIADVVV